MQVLYSFSFVWREILDFQIWLSRFSIAASVMAMGLLASQQRLQIGYMYIG